MKTDLIERTFKAIDSSCRQFVTLRNFDHIPDQSTLNNDIDVLVLKSDIDSVTDTLKGIGYNVTKDNMNYLYGAEPHTHFQNRVEDVHFDIVTGLYYRSMADDNIMVNTDQKLVESMLNNRVDTPNCWLYEPAVEDYLAHICCHVIFDKKTCTDRYHQLINTAFNQCNEQRLEELLKLVFFSSTENLLECISNNQSKSLVDVYTTSAQY